jgi:predicted ATPase
MRLSTIYVRFYRAFNFDYLRKHSASATPSPWDIYQGLFYPYVKVDLDGEVTSVVGANESGKSQLLDAVEFALCAKNPDPRDFCRYSQFFTVHSGLRVPHFGLRLSNLTPDERSSFAKWAAVDEPTDTDDVRIFREDPNTLKVFIGAVTDPVHVKLGKVLPTWLPRAFRIDPTRPIPDSVPIEYLAKGGKAGDKVLSRRERWSLVDPLVRQFGAIKKAIAANPPNPASLAGLLPSDADLESKDERSAARRREEFAVAQKLLVTVGGVDPSTFEKLQEALRAENEGFANGLVASINRQLAEALNLHRWWTQDEKFELQVEARDFDLVFTIRDRTASEYSFAERSSGLKYFLSYLVQYLAHLAEGESAQLLLMDEPDAFLSNQGQQDLLRLFQDFADRSSDGTVHQVVFVTHSPFLIDKNRADRVRVLDKGVDDEGARVVRDAGRNHFEPLRSAFGSFVGETTFIGNCNLLLEGVADQIYIAGLSSAFLRQGVPLAERIDLNDVTLVPAGSASHIPYMTYLARGRDVEQPAVIVLLDGDREGDEARKSLERGGARGRQVLDPRFVLQITPDSFPTVACDAPSGPREIEDLVPCSLFARACIEFGMEVGVEVPDSLADEVAKQLTESRGMYKATENALAALSCELNLDKIGVARHVVQLIERGDEDCDRAATNFRALFTRLGELQRLALHERSRQGVGRRVDRTLSSFLADHPTTATRSDLKIALEGVEALLDATPESEEIRKQIRILRNEQRLTTDLAAPVEDLPSVRSSLEGMRYAGLLASQEEPAAQVPPHDGSVSSAHGRKGRRKTST